MRIPRKPRTLGVCSLVLVLASQFPACSRERVPLLERKALPDSTSGDLSATIPLLPVVSPLARSSRGACEVLESLKSDPRGPRFSVFGKIEGHGPSSAGAWQGALRVPFSPFLQLFLGETFKVDAPDEFYEKVKEEYKAGRLSYFKWMLINVAREIPSLFRMIQYSATNDKLQENFPGFHGEAGPIGDSLFLLLASKAGGVETGATSAEDAKTAEILTSEVPLFSESWEQVRTEVGISLAAAIASLKQDERDPAPRQTRLCGFVLWQRALGELFAMKGYRSPKLVGTPGDPSKQYFQEISERNLIPGQVDVGGAFFDSEKNASAVLSAEVIQSYDPAAKAFAVTEIPPQGLSSTGVQTVVTPGGVAALTSLLETGVQFYQATSPAAPWFKADGDSYILGDLTAKGGRAFLPHEAHGLALGMTIMAFKTLAAKHIVQVNAKGRALTPGQEASGFVLAEGAERQVRMPIQSVMKIARSVVYLDTALKDFSGRSADDWVELSPVYSRETLAKLVGKDLFNEAELSQLLKPEERSSVLREQLKHIPLPLALLLLQYTAKNVPGCAALLEWDLDTGKHQAVGNCDAATEAEFRSTLQLLGDFTRSPVLIQRALSR